MRRLRVLLPLLLLAGAALVWEALLQRPPESAATAPPGSQQIDYRLSGLDVTRMGPDGKPVHRLTAQTLSHAADDDTTRVEHPRLTVFQGDTPPWQVEARQAWISADGELVLLDGDVLITRAGADDRAPLRVETRNLRVQPRQDYAETDEAVRVETDDDWLDATGMQAWLRPPSRLKLLSSVKGRYVPQ